jgi:tellurite resistance protein TerC
VLRAIFIAVGAALLALFSFMFLIFGALLIWTGIQLYRHRGEDPDIENNLLVRTTRRFLPVSDTYVNGKLIARVDGRRVVTPLFVVLIAIGGTDILFALDSIPAVFGITEEAYIVFVANAFALLGLRALFFLVTGLLDRLVYLAIGLSLAVIVVILAVTTVASLIKVRRDPSARAHAGSVTKPSGDSSVDRPGAPD